MLYLQSQLYLVSLLNLMSANLCCVNYSSGISSFHKHRKPKIRYINAIDLMTQTEEKQSSFGRVIEQSTILEDFKKYKLESRKYIPRTTQPDYLKPLPTIQSKRVNKSNLRPRASSKFEIELPLPSPVLKTSSPTRPKAHSVSPIAVAEMYLDNLIKNRQEIMNSLMQQPLENVESSESEEEAKIGEDFYEENKEQPSDLGKQPERVEDLLFEQELNEMISVRYI